MKTCRINPRRQPVSQTSPSFGKQLFHLLFLDKCVDEFDDSFLIVGVEMF